MVSSRIALAWATLAIPEPTRSCGRRCIIPMKPLPSSPSRFSSDPDVVEEQLGRVGLVHAHLVELAPVDEALHAALDHEEGDHLGALGRVGRSEEPRVGAEWVGT